MTDHWSLLRTLTQARIGLGRAGHGLPTNALLDCQLAHARARDAIHLGWNVNQLATRIAEQGLNPVVLSTQATDRVQYLKRPDLGRRLSADSRALLEALQRPIRSGVALILSNGLSSIAIERHGLELLTALVAALKARDLDPDTVFLVPNGRVALSDDIGSATEARLAIIVVGERPGLSAADSLGIYLTANPGPGKTDADRNCISNVRPPDGLSYETAAAKLATLASEALRRGYSGILLKDDSPAGLSADDPSHSAALLHRPP
jgi:ethanolamine ammonia-lyase small subunit